MDQVVLCISRQNQRRLGQMLACLNGTPLLPNKSGWKKEEKTSLLPKNRPKKRIKNITTAGASDRIKLFAKWKTSKSGKSDFWPRNQNFKELPKSESFSLKKVTSARGHPGTVTWEHGQLLIRMVGYLVSWQICGFFLTTSLVREVAWQRSTSILCRWEYQEI